jgi:hypothetical protein
MPRAHELLLAPRRELIGRRLQDTLPPEGRPAMEASDGRWPPASEDFE